MFDKNSRYVTRGIYQRLSPEMIVYLWDLIDRSIDLGICTDYLQVIKFKDIDENMVQVERTQEDPPNSTISFIGRRKEFADILTETIFVIDDGDHSTMLFAYEY